ncbi:MAG: glycosyltransferase family 4 protein [Anaerolineae bacterium]
MRIGMITGEYPPMQGGVGAFTEQLSRALCDRGHTVHILTACADEPSVQGDVSVGPQVERTVRSWGLPSILRIRRWIADRQVDVVNLQYEAAAFGMRAGMNFLPSLRSTVPGVPLVVTFHDLLPPYLFPKAGRLRDWSVRHLARTADGAIVTNHDDLRGLTEHHIDDETPVRLIPIGSNISPTPPPDYSKERWRAAHGFAPVRTAGSVSPGDHPLVVGFFGFLNRSKGVETLIAAIARLAEEGRPVHLLFIGGRTGTSDQSNVAYASEIDALIEELGITPRVHRTGFASPTEVSAALYAVDVCALPYREGANLRHGTLHAALAHACPIVTTQSRHPVPELVDGREALLVPPDDAEALANAIRALADDDELRRDLSAAAARLAARFTWPAIAAETEAFFASLRMVE